MCEVILLQLTSNHDVCTADHVIWMWKTKPRMNRSIINYQFHYNTCVHCSFMFFIRISNCNGGNVFQVKLLLEGGSKAEVANALIRNTINPILTLGLQVCQKRNGGRIAMFKTQTALTILHRTVMMRVVMKTSPQSQRKRYALRCFCEYIVKI